MGATGPPQRMTQEDAQYTLGPSLATFLSSLYSSCFSIQSGDFHQGGGVQFFYLREGSDVRAWLERGKGDKYSCTINV